MIENLAPIPIYWNTQGNVGTNDNADSYDSFEAFNNDREEIAKTYGQPAQ